jgi:PST family polysaccharide transporter
MAGLSLLSSAILARLLSPADFGFATAAILPLSLAGAIYSGAFGAALVQKDNLEEVHATATFNLSILFSLILAGLLVAFSPALERLFAFEGLQTLMIVASGIIIVKAVGSVSTYLIQRRQQFALLAIVNMFGSLAGVIVSVAAALYGHGVWSIIAGMYTTEIVLAVCFFSAARITLVFHIGWRETQEVFRSSGWLTTVQLFNWVANSGVSVLIGRTLGPEALGIYNRSWKLLDAATSAIAGPLQGVSFPAFSRLQNDHTAARAAFVNVLTITLPTFGLLSGLSIIHAEAIVLIALGPSWPEATLVMQLLYVGFVARCTYKISESLALGLGRAGGATLRQAAYAGLMWAGVFLGSAFGAAGVAAGASLAFWVFYALSVGYSSALVSLSYLHLMQLHLRAGALVAFPILVDALLYETVRPTNFWLANLLGLTTAAVISVFIILLVPSSWIGPVAAKLRDTLICKLRRCRGST